MLVQFFKAGKLFFRYDDVIMTPWSVVQLSKLGVLQFRKSIPSVAKINSPTFVEENPNSFEKQTCLLLKFVTTLPSFNLSMLTEKGGTTIINEDRKKKLKKKKC